jgi:hypothetical protein
VLVSPIDERRAPDVIGHLRRLAKAAVPAGMVAAVVGVVAAVYLMNVQRTYTATVIAQVDAQIPVVSGDAYLYQMTGPYLALAESLAVRQAIAHDMGVEWDPARVGASVAVEASKSPLLLEVSASAPSRSEALKLALSTVSALDGQSRAQRREELERAAAAPRDELAVVQQQIAEMDRGLQDTYGFSDATANDDPQRAALQRRADELNAQINRIRESGVNGLSVLSAPGEDDVEPTIPVSASLLAFVVLVVFIVTCELLVFVRGRFGRRLTEVSADWVVRTRRIPLETRGVTDVGFPPVTAGLIARRVGRGQRTMVITTAEAEPTVRTWLEDDGSAAYVDVESIDSGWAARLTDAVGLVIIVACSGQSARTVVDRAARALCELGIPRRLVLVADGRPHNSEPEVEVGAQP